MSSPLTYSRTSSPCASAPEIIHTSEASPRKRRKLDNEKESSRTPLGDVPGNLNIGLSVPLPETKGQNYEGAKTVAGFLLDDSESENEQESTLTAGRTMDIGWEDKGQSLESLSTVANPLVDVRVDSAFSDAHAEESSTPAWNQRHLINVETCSGKVLKIKEKTAKQVTNYERLIAARSAHVAGRAQRSFYGIEIHDLIAEAKAHDQVKADTRQAKDSTPSIEAESEKDLSGSKPRKTLLWTEKYRARKFTDLVGDERTHRSVLRWLKAWDPIVFPSQARPKSKLRSGTVDHKDGERTHRKVLLLTGPPGLGKTTLAHVCARQAGYEVQEINASDERSKDVVKGRIRDMVATENVRPANVNGRGKQVKAARPVCVVVDEVDGVVSGSGGAGEGGFIKALIDLLALDQKNSVFQGSSNSDGHTRRKKKGDNFRLLRPLILICNDVYHPSLRLLRQGTIAEIVHVRRPPLNMVVPRLHSIFEREGIPADGDGVRHLCEAAWGVSNRKEGRSGNGSCEGDMRGILVIGEWVATKIRNDKNGSDVSGPARLTRRWLEQNVLGDLAHGGGAVRSLGRGGSKEVVDRLFVHNAGFPTSSGRSKTNDLSEISSAGGTGVAEASKKRAMERLQEMIESSGEDDRIMTDAFTQYPTHPFQDDTLLSKPCQAYDWLHFHDTISSLVHHSQEWELAPYLTHPVLAFHNFFASTAGTRPSYANNSNNNDSDNIEPEKEIPFSGPRAPYAVSETTRANTATLTSLHSLLSISLHRTFSSPSTLATDLIPYISRLLNPAVNPVVIGGSGTDKSVASVRRASEREKVSRAVESMIATGVRFERTRVELGDAGFTSTLANTSGGWIYRMEPALDALSVYETFSRTSTNTSGSGSEPTTTSVNNTSTTTTTTTGGVGKVRYAIRQVLDQEHKRETTRRELESRSKRGAGTFTASGLAAATQDAEKSRRKNKPLANPDGAGIGAPKGAVVKRDFFGRPITTSGVGVGEKDGGGGSGGDGHGNGPGNGNAKNVESGRIWVTYREGFSNAVRKGITLKELMDGL